jgi:hypothetical protein
MSPAGSLGDVTRLLDEGLLDSLVQLLQPHVRTAGRGVQSNNRESEVVFLPAHQRVTILRTINSLHLSPRHVNLNVRKALTSMLYDHLKWETVEHGRVPAVAGRVLAFFNSILRSS